MMTMGRGLRFAFAFAAIGAIASQLPLSGTTALAQNGCTINAGTNFFITSLYGGVRGARNTYAVPRRRAGLVLYSFLGRTPAGGRPTYTQQPSLWTISGSGFSFSPTSLVTTTTGNTVRVFRFGAPTGAPATITAQSQATARLVSRASLL